jgi:hypothetical protein
MYRFLAFAHTNKEKVCKGGIEGLDNKPWTKVAKSKKTLLTHVIVEDVIDPMPVPMAITHFCSEVENVMRDNRDLQAASLTQCIRSWWHSEDQPGIQAADRIKMRIPLRNRLLADVDFGLFPPRTMYIKGWPTQLWEALVASMDQLEQI